MVGRVAAAVAVLSVLAAAGPLAFTGSVSLTADRSFVSGDDSLLPPRSELSLALSPTVSLWGFPVSMSFLATTSGNNFGEELNRYSFLLRPAEWARGLLGMPGFLLDIKGVELGACTPTFSRLSLFGLTVNGGALELEPWNIHLAATAGRTEWPRELSDTTDPSFARTLYAVKLGYGRQEKTHFHLTALYAQDDPNSIVSFQRPETTVVEGDTIVDTLEVVTPHENLALGLEFHLGADGSPFRLESEIVGTEVTRDRRMDIVRFDWLPDWVENTFKPRMSTSIDFAFSVRPTLNLLDTKVYGEVEMVGPGYRSLGAPSLRNDNLAYRAGIERGFFDNQVFGSFSVTTERDNLLAVEDSAGQRMTLKGATTRFTSYAADLSVSFPRAPYLQVGYMPSFQTSDSFTDRTTVVSVSTGYGFSTGSLSHSPSVSLSWQDYSSGGAGNDYTTTDVSPYYTVGFGFPLSLSAGGCYALTTYAGDSTRRLVSLELSPSYTLFGAWTNSLSVSGSFDAAGSKYSARLGSRFPVWKIAHADVGVEYGNYVGDDGRYGEWRLSAGLSQSW